MKTTTPIPDRSKEIDEMTTETITPIPDRSEETHETTNAGSMQNSESPSPQISKKPLRWGQLRNSIFSNLLTTIILGFIVLFFNIPPFQSSTLERVRDRGYLRCGVNGNSPGLSVIENTDALSDLAWDDRFYVMGSKLYGTVNNRFNEEAYIPKRYDKEAIGFFPDLCKAMALAIFGNLDGNRVVFQHIVNVGDGFNEMEQYPWLRRIDVAFRNTTKTAARTKRGVAFGPIVLIDTATVMYNPEMVSPIYETEPPTDTLSVINMLKDTASKDRQICVLDNTTTKDILISNKIATDTLFISATTNTLLMAYNEGKCFAISSDWTQLYGWRQDNDSLKDHPIVPTAESLSFEPLAPYVAEGDPQWLKILNHVIWATMQLDLLVTTDAELMEQLSDMNIADTESRLKAKVLICDLARSVADSTSEINSDKDIHDENRCSDDPEIQKMFEQFIEYFGIIAFDAAEETQDNPLARDVRDPVLDVVEHYVLKISGEIGSYSEIYEKHFDEQENNSVNCVYNHLESEETSRCHLIVPPLGSE